MYGELKSHIHSNNPHTQWIHCLAGALDDVARHAPSRIAGIAQGL